MYNVHLITVVIWTKKYQPGYFSSTCCWYFSNKYWLGILCILFWI